jgi:platelet-activating factor acetylhydrolase
VFIILPEYINKLTGLRIEAYRVLDMTVNAISRFLGGEQTKDSQLVADAVTVQGDGGPPAVGREGMFLYHAL